jgi:hypothetical protein
MWSVRACITDDRGRLLEERKKICALLIFYVPVVILEVGRKKYGHFGGYVDDVTDVA